MVMLILRKNRKEADNLSASPSFESIHGGGKEIEDQQCIKCTKTYIRAMRERCGQIDDSEILVQPHEIYPPSSKGKSVDIEMA
ncbi:hypothetical protein NC651_036105 [Populus alba x Populus x berolinensis]|nr:hypothetical protein NC651_036105 [Populus alba x Populus x berolinensis]